MFSENQVRQLYVATANTVANASALKDAAAGTPAVFNDGNGHIYLNIVGKGGVERTDLIDLKNVISATAVTAKGLDTKKYTVTLKSDVNGGLPIAGENYILRIYFKQFGSIGEEDVYIKYGAVYATTNMSASVFYVKMAVSLAKNFSREPQQLVKISLVDTDSNEVPVTLGTKEETLTATYTSVVITEAPQPYKRGKMSRKPLNFEVIPTTVTDVNTEVVWGNAVASKAGEINASYALADLEYFCMGERADLYRGMGYPNNIDTEYMITPSDTAAYAVIDIHYAFVGENESVQKSEKTLTIVCTTKTVANNITSKLKTVSGNVIDIPTIS